MKLREISNLVRASLNDGATAILTFWLTGLAASALVIALVPYTTSHRLVAWICLGGAGVVALVRVLFRHRLAEGSTHVDILAATALISIVIGVAPSTYDVGAVFYVWVAVFVGLYYRPRAAFFHLATIGVAYALVLVAQSTSLRTGLSAWFSVVGTATALSWITGRLVGALRASSQRDPLTHLANRRTWNSRIVEEIERARRYAVPLSVASIDVDNFKVVNDRFGHQAGDRLLKELAREWSDAIRGSGDFLARVGGDEFALLAPGSGEEEIAGIAERLAERQPEGVVCSIGVATWDGVEDAESLYARADHRMFEIKQAHHASDQPS